MGPSANGSGPRGSSPANVLQVPWLTWPSMRSAFPKEQVPSHATGLNKTAKHARSLQAAGAVKEL